MFSPVFGVKEVHMKRFLSIMLAAMAVLSLFAFPSAAADEVSDGEVARIYEPSYDLFELPDILKAYRRDPSAAMKAYDMYWASLNSEDEIESKTFPYKNQMNTISDMNYILLPGFADTSNLNPGDLSIKMNTLGVYEIYGENFNLDFYGTEAEAGKNFPTLTNSNPDWYCNTFGEFTVTGYYQYKTSETVVSAPYAPGYTANIPFYDSDDIVPEGETEYRNTLYISAYGYCYKLIVFGSMSFDELLADFDMKVFPLSNGFVNLGSKKLYNYNASFLKGWYKIGGKLYYFDKDGVMATGTVTINKRKYRFGEDGVYVG
jgi:hypothetical protein